MFVLIPKTEEQRKVNGRTVRVFLLGDALFLAVLLIVFRSEIFVVFLCWWAVSAIGFVSFARAMRRALKRERIVPDPELVSRARRRLMRDIKFNVLTLWLATAGFIAAGTLSDNWVVYLIAGVALLLSFVLLGLNRWLRKKWFQKEGTVH